MAVTANPNIIMGFRAPEIQNPMALAAQGEQIRSARNQNAMAEATLAAAPAKAAQELKQTMLGNVKDIVGTSASAEEANAKIRSLGGGADTTEFEFTSPEHFGSVKNTLFPQKSGAKPQIIQDASGSYTIDPETYAATQIEGVGGKVFAPQKPTPDKLTLGGDESGQYIINMNTGEKTPVLGVKSSPVKPTVLSTEAASEASDVLTDIEALKKGDLGSIYGKGESLFPDIARRQSSIDMMARRDRIASMLDLAQRGKIKGQGSVSDSDAKVIAQAASVLKNPEISPDLALAEFERIQPIFERIVNKNTQQSTQTQQAQLTPVRSGLVKAGANAGKRKTEWSDGSVTYE